jgi:hypothetical protein
MAKDIYISSIGGLTGFKVLINQCYSFIYETVSFDEHFKYNDSVLDSIIKTAKRLEGLERAKIEIAKKKKMLEEMPEKIANMRNRVHSPYENHCWKCHSGLSSYENRRCSACNGLICPNCGNCLCGYDWWYR